MFTSCLLSFSRNPVFVKQIKFQERSIHLKFVLILAFLVFDISLNRSPIPGQRVNVCLYVRIFPRWNEVTSYLHLTTNTVQYYTMKLYIVAIQFLKLRIRTQCALLNCYLGNIFIFANAFLCAAPKLYIYNWYFLITDYISQM